MRGDWQFATGNHLEEDERQLANLRWTIIWRKHERRPATIRNILMLDLIESEKGLTYYQKDSKIMLNRYYQLDNK